MNYRLSTGLIALGVSFVVGSSALAAPGVSYKKQLSVPVIPAATVSKIAAMDWQYPTTASSTNGLSTFKNVVVQKPVLFDEKECGDTIYRMWKVSVDPVATKKTQPTITSTDLPYYGTSYGTRFVFEARTPAMVKWHIDSMQKGMYDFNHPAPDSIFGCKGKDVIVAYLAENPRNDTSNALYRTVPYAKFTTDAGWESAVQTIGAINVNRGFNVSIEIDGIRQTPGILVVQNGEIVGDSRIVFVDPKQGIQIHKVPHYRDLTSLPASESIEAIFYKTKDGYLVIETDFAKVTEAPRFYRIHNGESRYSLVDLAGIQFQGALDLVGKGVTLVHYIGNETKDITVHGIATPDDYSLNSTILWENNYQVYARYLITNKKTGKQQYWEATVNKN